MGKPFHTRQGLDVTRSFHCEAGWGRIALKTLEDGGREGEWHTSCNYAKRSTYAPGKEAEGERGFIWQQQLYLHAFADARNRRATIGFWPRLRPAAASRSCRGTGIWR